MEVRARVDAQLASLGKNEKLRIDPFVLFFNTGMSVIGEKIGTGARSWMNERKVTDVCVWEALQMGEESEYWRMFEGRVQNTVGARREYMDCWYRKFVAPYACYEHCYGSKESVAFMQAKTNAIWGADCHHLMESLRQQKFARHFWLGREDIAGYYTFWQFR